MLAMELLTGLRIGVRLEDTRGAWNKWPGCSKVR